MIPTLGDNTEVLRTVLSDRNAFRVVLHEYNDGTIFVSVNAKDGFSGGCGCTIKPMAQSA